ncbi:hypothetical protein BGZ76_003813 [Entomortierella beljakovae]|nr:hypothetical protein BGZ76_003813 [Entomortierella beljakovae]
MFVQWALVFVNLILVTTRFLVVASVGAILAIYSRLRGEHANSIRWVRQGGFMEMLHFLINTRKEITLQAKAALLFTILATISASLAGRGVVSYVVPSVGYFKPQNVTISSIQSVGGDGDFYIPGWSSSIFKGANIIEAMISLANDTKVNMAIPDPVAGSIYKPVLFDYRSGCDNFQLVFFADSIDVTPESEGCARIAIGFFGPISLPGNDLAMINRTSTRWSFSLLAIPMEFQNLAPELSPTLFVKDNNTDTTCAFTDFSKTWPSPGASGLSSLPTTTVTKCVYPTGDINSVSMSVIRFMTSSVQQFADVSKSLFDEYDELFQTMEGALNSAKLLNATFFGEMTHDGGSANTLYCLARLYNGEAGNAFLSCSYVIVEAIILERQDINPDILAAQNVSELPTPPRVNSMMTFTHIPKLIVGESKKVSISYIRDLTINTSDYFAKLGQNLLINWETGRVSTIFTVVYPEEGLEIPLWLILSVPIVAVICAILVGITEYFLDSRYTSSLYKAISIPVSRKLNLYAPMLMRSRVNAVEFEGIPVIPGGNRFEVDVKNVATLLSDNNSSIASVDEKHSFNKLNESW